MSKTVSDTCMYDDDKLDYSLFDENTVGDAKAKENIKKFDSFSKNVEKLSNNFIENNTMISYNFYGYDKQLRVVQYINGLGIFNTMGYQKENITNEQVADIMHGKTISGRGQDKYTDYAYSCSPIYNRSGKILGAIEFKGSISVLDYQLNSVFLSILITLVLAAIVIYLLISLCVRIRQSIKLYKDRVKEKIPHPEICLTPTSSFFRNLIIYADSVMCVLITKGMLEPYGLGDNGILLAIPLSVAGFGALLIGVCFNKMFKNINIRKVYIINNLLMLISFIFQAYSVLIGNIFMFTACKFFSSFFNGAIYVADTSLPMCIDNDKLRFKTFREISLTDISSPILSVFFAGLLSNFFGAFSIYLMCAVIAAFMLEMSMIFMPSNLYFKHVDSTKTNLSMQKLLKFFLSPSIIGVVIVCFISITVSGYKSYLFPLYTTDLNISATNISNYFTIVMAFSLLLSRWIDSFERQFDHWRAIIIYLCMIGIVLCMFITNTTLVWALVTLLLSSVLQKLVNTEWKVIWSWKCKELNIDPASLQPSFIAIEYAVISLRQLVLGALLVFGSGGACVAFGGLVFICAFAFYLLTRKSSLVK